MPNPPDLAADLPPPRDDEPASLRQDIVDELADHLHCALRREQLAGPSASGGCQAPDGGGSRTRRETASGDSSFRTAPSPEWQRVLTRFGNPAAVARRLWLDAMKERLMAQRLMTAASLVAAIAACVMVLFVWRSLDADRQVVMASLNANRDLISQLNATNARLMDQLDLSRQTLEELSAGGSQNVEWVPCEIQLRRGSEDGPPAAGVKVTFMMNHTSSGSPPPEVLVPPINLRTDKSGLADFGLVHFGYYRLRLKMPWDEHADEGVTVHPGKPISRVIVVPEQPLDPVEVAIRVQWPDGFAHDDIWIVLWRLSLSRSIAGLDWRVRDIRQPFRGGELMGNLINPSGAIFDLHRNDDKSGEVTGSIGGSRYKLLKWIGRSDAVPAIELPDSDYSFHDVGFRLETKRWPQKSKASGEPVLVAISDQDLAIPSDAMELTAGPSRELVITIPDAVADKLAQYREIINTQWFLPMDQAE